MPAVPRAGEPSTRRRRLAWLVPVALLAAALAVAGLLTLGLGDRGDRGSRASDDAQRGGTTTAKAPAATERRPAKAQQPPAQRTESRPRAESKPRPERPAAKASPPATAPVRQPSVPANPVALNDQGFARIRAGDYAGAVPLLERSVTAFREQGRKGEIAYAFALFNLGQALNRSGRPADAMPYLVERLAVSDFKRRVVEAELARARRAAGARGRPGKGDKGDD
jgi:serine/threonine-protein kinase